VKKFFWWTAVLFALPSAASHAQTHTDAYELICKSQQANQPNRRFGVVVWAAGDVHIADKDVEPKVEHDVGTYVNAFLWRVGKDLYVVDRFSGALSINQVQTSLICEKIGGRKF